MDSIYVAYKAGKLDDALKLGVIRPSIVGYLKIYEIYNAHRQLGMSYTRAVSCTAITVCLAEITVKKAIAEVI